MKLVRTLYYRHEKNYPSCNNICCYHKLIGSERISPRVAVIALDTGEYQNFDPSHISNTGYFITNAILEKYNTYANEINA